MRRMTMTMVGTLATLKYSHVDWPLHVCDPVSPCQWRLFEVSSCHQVSAVNLSTHDIIYIYINKDLSKSVHMLVSSFHH